MADEAHRNGVRLYGLFASMLSGEGKEAYYAAWALTHLPKEDDTYINMYRARLTDFAIATADASLRRLSLTLLVRLEWSVGDIRTDFLDFCLAHLASPAEPVGIRSLCIKLAYAQCRHYDELRDELRECLALMEQEHLNPGLRHTRDKTLHQL